MKRRNFLKVLSTVSLTALFDQTIKAASKEFIGENTPNSHLKNYIQFNLFGAPSRWTYDNPLSPYGESFMRNSYVGTHFKHGDQFKDDVITYKHVEFNKVNFPYLWDMPPLDNSSQKNFSHLTSNFANVRGIWIGRDGHIPASEKMLREKDDFCLKKLFEAEDDAFLDGFITGDTPVVDTKDLISHYDVFHLKNINYFQEAFSRNILEAKSLKVDDQLQQVIVENLKVLDRDGLRNEKKIKTINELKKIKEKFVSDFPEILDKYYKIFARSKELLIKKELLPKIFDRNLKGTSINPVADGLVFNRSMSRFHVFTEHSNIVDGFKNAEMDLWLNHFAIAEFLVTNGFTKSVILAPQSKGNYFENFYYENVISKSEYYNQGDIGNLRFYKKKDLISFYGPIEMDTHNTGSMLNLMASSYFFYVFHSCLNSLISTLKEKNMFDSTLIHVASEFERKPREREIGSTHNSAGQVHSLYSGRISGPVFLGDVHRVDPINDTHGSCNTGAKHKDLKRLITYNDFQFTLSCLFGDKQEAKGRVSLLKWHQGKIQPNISRSRLV